MNARKDTTDDAPLREELAQLRADIDNLVGTVGRLANGAADTVAQRARRTATDAGGRAEDAYKAILAEGKREIEAGEALIKNHPYASIAVAAGVGLLIGRLMSRP